MDEKFFFTSIRITKEAKEMREKISKALGISKADVIEMAIRRLFRVECGDMPEVEEKTIFDRANDRK